MGNTAKFSGNGGCFVSDQAKPTFLLAGQLGSPGDVSGALPQMLQQLSPALEDKLAYFATVAGTYESAAQLAGKMGIAVEDSTVCYWEKSASAGREKRWNWENGCIGKPADTVWVKLAKAWRLETERPGFGI